MKIGLLGGTFNPIHLGHLIISEYIRVNYPLDKIIFIPTGNPPHKNRNEIIDAYHRYKMVEMAIETNPFFELSDIEINRMGKSYTIDTIEEISSKYKEANMSPNHPPACCSGVTQHNNCSQNLKDDIYFIIGGDTLFELTTWKEIDRLFKMTNFLVVGRHGIEDNRSIDKINELKSLYNARIQYFDGPGIEISSTGIRENIKNNKNIKYLVPESVENYIELNRLYVSED